MEKRLLLAFVLSLAVFIGWGAFLAKFQPPPKKQTDTAKSLEQPEVPPQNQSAVPSSPLAPSADTPPTAELQTSPFPGNEKEIQVEAGSIHYVFSNKGGVLKHIYLPRFKNDNGDTIDLIDNPGKLTPALSLKSDDKEITSILQNAFYEPSISSIVLIPPPTDKGIKIFLAVLETKLLKLFVPYKVATLSI